MPYTGDGPLVSSHPDFDGMHNREALTAIVAWLDREGKGHASVNYRLRDWLVSRQRYWGCPIPIVYCEDCGMQPVPVEQLPVILPDVEDYAPARALARWRAPRSGSLPSAHRAVGPPAARPTRWTRSSTPPGTSCATATPATNRPPGIRPPCANGCPSTSTSAGSSTRSCTSCTRASSPRPWRTSASSTSKSPSRRCSLRGWSPRTAPR